MRPGIAAAGRALVGCLGRVTYNPHLFESPDFASSLLSKSGAPVFRREHHGMEVWSSSSSLWSQWTLAPFALQGVMDGHRRFAASGLEGVPRAQNHVFLQGLATRTPTETPLNSKAASETKASSANTSSLPPPPPTGMGKPEEKPRRTKNAGIVKQMLLDFGAVPFPALVLGISGLIPFVALAPPLVQMLPLPDILGAGHAHAQAAYAASIISFLGAIHWGLAMADYAAPGKGGVANMTLMTLRYVWSVVPSLMAWMALLLPATTKFAVLIFSLWMVLGVDFLFARLRLVPYWFLSLRWPLTFVASVSMVPSMLAAATWTS